MLQLCICRDDYREARFDRRAKEHTIPQAEPTLASIRRYIGDGEFFGQFDR